MTDRIYPRKLRPKEWDVLEFTLPFRRPGYRTIRERIEACVVLAEGRRGIGHLVLGLPSGVPDHSSPLAPVLSCGVVESTNDLFSVAVREPDGDQIDVEIMSGRGDEIPDHFEEKRRWTYSTWSPGDPSPATGRGVREVRIDGALTLAIAAGEKRLWVHDTLSGMVHLIPITNFYNELMIHKHIREPKTALQSGLFFDQLNSYTDADLCAAFVAYNMMRRRVMIHASEQPGQPGSLQTILGRFRRKKA